MKQNMCIIRILTNCEKMPLKDILISLNHDSSHTNIKTHIQRLYLIH